MIVSGDMSDQRWSACSHHNQKQRVIIGLLSPQLSLFVSLSRYSPSGVSIFMWLHFVVITSLCYFIMQVVSRLSLSVCSKAEHQRDACSEANSLFGFEGSEAEKSPGGSWLGPVFSAGGLLCAGGALMDANAHGNPKQSLHMSSSFIHHLVYSFRKFSCVSVVDVWGLSDWLNCLLVLHFLMFYYFFFTFPYISLYIASEPS